jgi:hypothetical protein
MFAGLYMDFKTQFTRPTDREKPPGSHQMIAAIRGLLHRLAVANREDWCGAAQPT